MHNRRKTRFAPFRQDDDTWADEQTNIAEGISIPPIDRPEAHSTPESIGRAWHEDEYDELAEEQILQWEALGESAAREDTVVAAGLAARKAVAEDSVEEARLDVAEARRHRTVVRQVLLGQTRRSPHAELKYWGIFAFLFGGDVAGVTGAAVYFGEIPYLAVLQAISSAAAAVTAGFVGHDIAVARHARRRQSDPKDLTGEQLKFAYLFTGGDAGERIVKGLLYLALTVALLVVGGIFALRSGVEGGLAGLVFGFLAGAIATASTVNSYHFADEISDLLDRAEQVLKRALKKYKRASENPVLCRFDEARSRAESIKAEHASRGLAAARKVRALKHAVSRLNPQIMGHGRRPAPPVQTVLFTDGSSTEAPLRRASFNGHRS